MTFGARALGAVGLAAALAASGCGDKCPTESPAKVQAIQSCTAAPGAQVSVQIQLCPTCNQSGATCSVDTSGAGSGSIELDPTVEACDSVSTCPSTAPSCSVGPLTCTFTAPSTPDRYQLLVYDPSTGGTIAGTLDVGSGPSSCQFSSALLSR
jgi:hypothetical protein